MADIVTAIGIGVLGIVATWPFVGAICAMFVYKLYGIFIMREGVWVRNIKGKGEEKNREALILSCVIGGLLGWVMILITPILIFLWLFLQFMSIMSGAKMPISSENK